MLGFRPGPQTVVLMESNPLNLIITSKRVNKTRLIIMISENKLLLEHDNLMLIVKCSEYEEGKTTHN